ncbi:MAG TPA: flagellar basal body P-ring formation chaperone FlgA, partial [Rhodocyclaceae bacterium]|nr:flagellar basal body P-ring formation chaperone FlgA [Rhodocyclaceae bacterium]
MNLLARSGCARYLSAILCLALLSAPALATSDNLRSIAETYVRNQTRGLPGEVAIQIGQLEATSQLPACTNIQAFTPNGGRLWGKTFVGIRCLAPQPWNVLIPVQVSVIADYLVTARALAAGQPLQASDFALLRGDLSALPAGVVTDRNAVAGKTLKNGLGAGQPLRQDLLL